MRLDPVNRLKYFVERQLVKGTQYQLLVVAALVGLISLVGGLLALGTGDPDEDIRGAVWWAFLRLTDPGYLGDDAGVWRRIVSTVLTVSGYVVFMGTLIAILTRWLIARMEELERGLTPVSMRQHVVVLGWTNRTLPIVRELLLSQGGARHFLRELVGGRRLRLVVLVEDLGPVLAEEVRSDPVARRHQKYLVLRSGSALNPDHLNRAGCLRAAAVIVPARTFDTDSAVTSDVETIKALLSLDGQAQSEGGELPYVVAEIQDPRKIEVARRAYGGRIEVVAGDASISRLMVQNVRHPGLSAVYTELLSHDIGNNLYIVGAADLAGRTVGELQPLLRDSILCGVVRTQEQQYCASLNLPRDFRIEAGDELVMIARSFDVTGRLTRGRTTAGSAAAVDPVAPDAAAIQGATGGTQGPGSEVPRRVLIIGWSRKVPALLREFATYGRDSFRITVLSTRPIKRRQQILADEGISEDALECSHVEADFTLEQVLRDNHPETFDAIMLMSSDRVGSKEEADARSIMAFLALEALLQEAGAKPQVLIEFSDPHNERLMGHHAGEVILSPLLLSHILAQVTLRQELRIVFDALFSVGGPEISFRAPQEYGLCYARVTFEEIQQRVDAWGETALGIQRARVRSGGSRRIELNPRRGVSLALNPGDELIVMLGG